MIGRSWELVKATLLEFGGAMHSESTETALQCVLVLASHRPRKEIDIRQVGEAFPDDGVGIRNSFSLDVLSECVAGMLHQPFALELFRVKRFEETAKPEVGEKA